MQQGAYWSIIGHCVQYLYTFDTLYTYTHGLKVWDYKCLNPDMNGGFAWFCKTQNSLRYIKRNAKFKYTHQVFFFFPSFFLLHSSFHLASYYLLLFVVWHPSRWPAFLALWFCSGDFISLLIVPTDWQLKLRYENKQLALELTAEKKSTLMLPHKSSFFACPCRC